MPRISPYSGFGVECNEGWKGLYQPLLDLCKLYNIPVLQVKEKFGGLRFYIGPTSESNFDLYPLITAAEAQSFRTCEDCGISGSSWVNSIEVRKVTTEASETSGWIRSLCEPCRNKWDESRRPKSKVEVTHE